MRAAGRAGAVAVTVAQVSTQFCVLVLFFLISGINLNKLAPAHSTLFYSLLCTAALTPFMLLRPGHVWGTALFAIAASVILVVVVVVLCATGADHDPYISPPSVTFSTFGTGFGVILSALVDTPSCQHWLPPWRTPHLSASVLRCKDPSLCAR